MKRVAFMFPGQGSQAVGMGKEIYEQKLSVKELYDQANEVLHQDIKTMMFAGPENVLTKTENAQPALLLSSIAIHSLLIKEQIQPIMTVGHSLGEYSALVASGALSLEEALPLVSIRGQLMEEAFPKGQGTMAAVLGLSEEEIKNVLDEIDDEIVDLANINCPGQIVISGTVKGIERASAILKEKGARRILSLNVSGPFHSRLMESANDAFAEYLNKVDINHASIPVYANVTAQPVTDKEEIKNLLLRQLYSPVRFEESIQHMLEADIDAFVEIGHGKVLSGLVKKINRQVETFSISDVSSFNKFIQWYKEGN